MSSLLAHCMRRGSAMGPRMLRGMAAFSSSTASTSTADAPSFTPFTGEIPFEAVQKTFVLASGPGGQNVQKNATKAQIKVRLDESATWLDRPLREAVAKHLVNRINSVGEVVIESDRTRERQLNLADAIDKLRSTIYFIQRKMTAREETEEDVSIIREKAARAARHRLIEKRREAAKRQSRGPVEL